MSLAMLLLPLAPGHLLSSVVTPINLNNSGLAAKQPHVLLFLHIGKCGGTTVRSIFQHGGGWVRPIWSITQRFSGWKANRMLHSLHTSMAHGAQKIFIEWHLVRNLPQRHISPAESPPEARAFYMHMPMSMCICICVNMHMCMHMCMHMHMYMCAWHLHVHVHVHVHVHAPNG